MSEETLFTAARRAVRDFNIDMNKGGIITVETQRTMETLSMMVSVVENAEKRGWKLAFVAENVNAKIERDNQNETRTNANGAAGTAHEK